MLYFQIILGILVLLAIIDLIVGVSNDAVNFLNSAIGAKAASFRTILVIASAGVLLGTLFSSGMMQIARNGIFQPEFFTFDKVMLIFLAVMITDVILLDIYNSLGLPTSTTVSLIFELLGASFVIGLLILLDQQRPLSEIESILNYKNALFIIGGIFFSVIVAFGMGSCIHFFTRLLFTFKLKRSLTLFGPVFTGISTSALMYFLLIKGLEGSSFASSSMLEWIQHNTFLLLSTCFVLVTLFTSIAMRLWKFDPLRIIVLIGTFSLAMAFAGNDLVNFIGIFVAAYSSYEAWVVSGVAADAFSMGVLNQPVITPSALLLFSGVIMVLTLWISAKSKKVTETEVSLSRQDAGEEKFASSTWSRGLVSSGIYAGSVIKILMPEKWTSTIEKRFMKPKAKKKNGEEPSFDMLRASVNLVVSSTLIAFGTAQHLPLSTTFVTFMVAMGTTFADQAWGRESAVYRVSGVLQVLKGWVLTALVAFGGSALVALFLYFTGSIGALSLTLFTFGLLVYSQMLFKQKQRVEKEGDELIIKERIASHELIEQSVLKAALTIERVNRLLGLCLASLMNERPAKLQKQEKEIRKLAEENDKISGKIVKYIRKTEKGGLAAGRLNLLVFDILQDLYQSSLLVSDVCTKHITNFHTPPPKEFQEVLNSVEVKIHHYLNDVEHSIRHFDFTNTQTIQTGHDEIVEFLSSTLDKEISSIQQGEDSNRLSVLKIRIVLEMTDIIESTKRLHQLYIDFYTITKDETRLHSGL